MLLILLEGLKKLLVSYVVHSVICVMYLLISNDIALNVEEEITREHQNAFFEARKSALDEEKLREAEAIQKKQHLDELPEGKYTFSFFLLLFSVAIQLTWT